MSLAESRAVVAGIWRAFESGDLATVEASLHEDFVCDWPLTGERIAGRVAYIQVNREYPGTGTLRVIRITGTAELVVSEIEAEWGDPSARVRELAVSLFELRDGKVARLTEYWASRYDPPAWRGDASEREQRAPRPERHAHGRRADREHQGARDERTVTHG